MHHLVIGAGGFLGEKLTSHFGKLGHTVSSLSYRPERGLENFLRDVERFLLAGVHTVMVPGADQKTSDNFEAIKSLVTSNVVMPSILAESIDRLGSKAKLILFSTSWTLDDRGEYSPFNLYAATKQAMDVLVQHYAMKGVDITSLLLYDTYGEGDHRSKVLNLLVDAVLSEQTLNMSACNQLMDLVYIDDVCKAVELTLELDNSSKSLKRFDVRSGNTLTLNEIIAMLFKVLGEDRSGLLNKGFYGYRERERFALPSKNHFVPGWQPQIQLEEGLAKLIAWKRTNKKAGSS